MQTFTIILKSHVTGLTFVYVRRRSSRQAAFVTACRLRSFVLGGHPGNFFIV